MLRHIASRQYNFHYVTWMSRRPSRTSRRLPGRPPSARQPPSGLDRHPHREFNSRALVQFSLIPGCWGPGLFQAEFSAPIESKKDDHTAGSAQDCYPSSCGAQKIRSPQTAAPQRADFICDRPASKIYHRMRILRMLLSAMMARLPKTRCKDPEGLLRLRQISNHPYL
jgi:hypothetical protein